MASRCLGAKSALPITTAEFHQLFKQISQRWAPAWGPRRIALAISGGSDSMALAYLCSQLISERLVPNLQVKAFVVDHHARQESTEEARKVAGWMRDLGFESAVLPLQWAHRVAPASLKSFETTARHLRYRAFGQACLSHGAEHLLLGHHNDDNIETALLRLSGQHRKAGLLGFGSVASIPECEGLYGVSESGSLMSFHSIYQPGSPAETQLLEYPDPDPQSRLRFQDDLQPFIATGGVQICRPFRTVSKSRLVATCREAGVPFVTDPTNADPTVTPRNAVRQLLASDDLPQALRSESLSSLITKSNESRVDEFKLSNLLIQSCKILTCDLRTSSLVVQLPTLPELDMIRLKSKAGQSLTAGQNLRVQALAVQRLSSLVTRRNRRNSRGLHPFATSASNVFPGYDVSRKRREGDNPRPSRFVAAGVMWTPVERRNKAGKRLLPADFKEISSHGRDPNHMEPNSWLVSREPQPGDVAPPITEFSLRIPASSSTDERIETPWTDWQLWDERFWVRIRAIRLTNPNHNTRGTSGVDDQKSTSADEMQSFPATTVPITMRLLEEHDLDSISQHIELSGGHIRIPKLVGGGKRPGKRPGTRVMYYSDTRPIRTILREIAKVKIRNTLPVLSGPPPKKPLGPMQDERKNATKTEPLFQKGAVYALPSIDARMSWRLRVMHPAPSASNISASSEQSNNSTSSNRRPVSYWRLEWDLIHRRVDPEVFRLTGYKAPESSSPQPQQILDEELFELLLSSDV